MSILFNCWIFLFLLFSTEINSELCFGSEPLLDRALCALNRSLNYMEKYQRDINADGLLGVIMMHDQFETLEENNVTVKDEYRSYLPKLSLLREQAHILIHQALPYLQTQYSDMKEIKWFMEGQWKLNHINKLIDEKLWDRNSFDSGERVPSNQCMMEVTGSIRQLTCACKMSYHCWKLMTSPSQIGYRLTHQVLYLETVEMCECYKEMAILMKMFDQSSLQELYDRFCANMFFEAMSFAQSNFSGYAQDLFMEQIAVCGMIGYQNFYNSDWLENIICWQKLSGCYWNGTFSEEDGKSEKLVEGNCLSHKTSVAIASLAVSIRLMIT